jgi:hypothetical protein
VLFLERGLQFVIVMEFAQVGWCSSWVVQIRVMKLGLEVGVCWSGVVNCWFPFCEGVSLPTTSR